MAGTHTDKQFTDAVHKFASDREYVYFGWKPENADKKYGQGEGLRMDREEVVDYVGTDLKNGKNVLIQERSRRSAVAKNFNDVTIRNERLKSLSSLQKQSEMYKLRAALKKYPNDEFYFLYNVADETYEQDKIGGRALRKVALIDLRALVRHLDDGGIMINPNNKSKFCREVNGVVIPGNGSNTGEKESNSGYQATKNSTSSFLVFDVGMLAKNFDDVVLYAYGFKDVDRALPMQKRCIENLCDQIGCKCQRLDDKDLKCDFCFQAELLLSGAIRKPDRYGANMVELYRMNMVDHIPNPWKLSMQELKIYQQLYQERNQNVIKKRGMETEMER